MQQKRFKVLTEEKEFFELIYKIVINIMEKCFPKPNFEHL